MPALPSFLANEMALRRLIVRRPRKVAILMSTGEIADIAAVPTESARPANCTICPPPAIATVGPELTGNANCC